MTTGAFPITGLTANNLPLVTIAFPGEIWSDAKASGAITPGAAVVEVNDPTGSANVHTPGNALKCRVATSSDAADDLFVAMNVVREPDQNVGPSEQGPNEISNTVIADGAYLRRVGSGVLHLGLVVPGVAYKAGDKIGWDADGARPSGVSGSGAWTTAGAADIDDVFRCVKSRKLGASDEYILTLRFRGRSNN